jgi:hypothetical protein
VNRRTLLDHAGEREVPLDKRPSADILAGERQ